MVFTMPQMLWRPLLRPQPFLKKSPAGYEFIVPFFSGAAVAKMIGKGIIDLSGFGPQTFYTSAAFIITTLIGAIGWKLIT